MSLVLHLSMHRKLADSFAQGSQTTAFIPDLFNGYPISLDVPNLIEVSIGWIKKYPPTDATPIAEKIISTIKGNYQLIQVIGFCYGAKPVVHLITHPQFSSTIKAAVAAHPSFLVKEEAKQIKRPILFLCAENDSIFTPELRQQFGKELKSNDLGTFIDYPETNHGFVVRPDDSKQSQEQRDKAFQDAITFFKKNI